MKNYITQNFYQSNENIEINIIKNENGMGNANGVTKWEILIRQRKKRKLKIL